MWDYLIKAYSIIYLLGIRRYLEMVEAYEYMLIIGNPIISSTHCRLPWVVHGQMNNFKYSHWIKTETRRDDINYFLGY
jgi:hypothetical protein